MTHDNTQSDVVEAVYDLLLEMGCQVSREEASCVAQTALASTTDSDAVLEERERCARIADEHTPGGEYYEREYDSFTADSIAAAIRKGDNA